MNKYSLIILFIAFIFYAFAIKKEGWGNDKIVPEEFVIDTLARDLTVPWSMVFIDDSTLLFSERNGKVRLLRNDRLVAKPVYVLKDIDTTIKMGLLGVCLHPQFAENKLIYLASNYKRGSQSYLKVERFVFSNDSLWQPKTIVDGIYANRNHTGCRLKFFGNKLYITTGDADQPRLSQDIKSLNGKILRVNDDGTTPPDNPFFNNDTAAKQVWSYGHRNPQGIDFQPGTGIMYSSEHGPTGGDEINIIEKGKNYGWPLIHHTEKREGMVSPLLEFSPSIGPSEIVFYNKDAFPELKGKLLLANLRDESIMQFKVEKNHITRLNNLISKQYRRIRAITIAADGSIYFSTSQKDPPEGKPVAGYDMILRIRPGRGSGNINSGVIKKNIVPVKKPPVTTSVARTMYLNLCASCHGKNLTGTAAATSLRDNKWLYGSGKLNIIKNIKNGIINKGMPAWQGAISNKDIDRLANYILSINANKK